jgi:hypothetical protein
LQCKYWRRDGEDSNTEKGGIQNKPHKEMKKKNMELMGK